MSIIVKPNDFQVKLAIYENGAAIDNPIKYDFVRNYKVRTPSGAIKGNYPVSYLNGVYTNCKVIDNSLIAIFVDHDLPFGELISNHSWKIPADTNKGYLLIGEQDKDAPAYVNAEFLTIQGARGLQGIKGDKGDKGDTPDVSQIEDKANQALSQVSDLSNTLTGRIDAIVGENASSAIDNFNEILKFLEGIKDEESLTGLLERIRQDVEIAKSDGSKAKDLATNAQDTANQAKEVSNQDLINRGVFMPDSDLKDLPKGLILNFGIIDGIKTNKEYFISHIRKEKSLLQVTDAIGNVIAQYYSSSQTQAGIMDIILTPLPENTERFKALVNWDAIGTVTSFSKKIHINKANLFVDALSEINFLKTCVTTLESGALTVDQLKEILSTNAQFNGKGFYGLDMSKQQYFTGKILAIWGSTMPNYPIYITHMRNFIGSYGVLIQITTDNIYEPIAQFEISRPTVIKTGIEDITLSPVGGSGLTFRMSVNWDNISTDIPLTNEIQILELPTVKYDTSVLERLDSLDETVSNINTEELDRLVLEPQFYDVNSPDLTYIRNNCILDAWNVNMPEGQALYLGYLRNDAQPLIQFWYIQDDPTKIVAQYYVGNIGIQSGVQDITITGLPGTGLGGKTFKMRINWDLVPATITKTGLIMNTSWLRLSPNFDAFKRIYRLEKDKAPAYLQNELYLNIFGDVIPDSFKKKWFDVDNIKDLEILLLGDSIVGLISSSGAIDDCEAMFLPPSMDYYHWTWGLWDRIVKNKPIYDRLDAVRDGIATFEKIGTFEKLTSDAADSKLNTPPDFGEWSGAANTYQSYDTNAAVQFTWDLDAYGKLNLIHSLNPDGAPCKITVASGNGLIQVSTDKSVWIEANGFVVDQNSNPDNLTLTQCAEQGHALHQRHRRIWMRKMSDAKGVQSISFGRTDSDTAKCMYLWGVERWNHSTVIIQNIGRGGRDTGLLNKNISDVVDRNPDLVIHSLSLANEYTTKVGTPEDVNYCLCRNYSDFFFGGNSSRPDYVRTRSMLSKSDNYTKWAYLVIMPHGRGTYFSGNNAINAPATNDMLPYLKYRKMTEYVKEKGISYENLSVINLFDPLINEGRFRGMTIEETFGGVNQYSLTSDAIHLNKRGSLIWTKYLAPIFDVI